MKRSIQFSFATGPASPRAQVIGLSLAAIITALIALWTGMGAHDLEQNGARAVGTVISLREGEEEVYPVFSFTDTEGRQHVIRANVSSNNYAVGDRLNIVYPPSTPLNASIDSFWSLYFFPVLFGILSVGLLTGAGLIAKYRHVFQADYIQRRGKLETVRQNPDGTTTRSTRSSLPLLKWTARIFGTISVLCFCAAGWTAWQSYSLTQNGVETRASVVRLVRTGSSHRPIFEFVDTSGETQVVESHLTTNNYLVGDALPVIYLPEEPQGARIYEILSLLGTPAYFCIVGTLCLLVTLIVRSQLRSLGTPLAKQEPQ